MTAIKLNSSRSPRSRYYLINDGQGMGGYGHPSDHYLNQWVVVNGVDRGRGYQGCMSIDYAISSESHLPNEAKRAIKRHLSI